MRNGATVFCVLLLWGGGVFAQDGPLIEDAPLLKRIEDQAKAHYSVQRGQMKPDDFLARYFPRDTKDKREMAVRYYLYGRAHQLLDRSEEAQKQYRKALETYRGFPRARLALGEAYLRLKSDGEAEKQWRLALSMKPDYAPAIFNLARIAGKRKRFRKSMKLVEQSLRLDPKQKAAYQLRIRLHIHFWRNSFTKSEKKTHRAGAIRTAGRYAFTFPNDPLGPLMTQMVYRALQSPKRAIAILERAILSEAFGKKEAVQAEFLVQLLELYLQTDQPKMIDRTLERLLKFEKLPAESRKRFEKMLKELRGKGKEAYLIWQIEPHLKIVANDGYSLEERLSALETLTKGVLEEEGIRNNPKLHDVFQRARRTVLRTCFMSKEPEMLAYAIQHIRRSRDTFAFSLLSHFVYPRTQDSATPAVRIEAVRTYGSFEIPASFIVLLHCLNDPHPAVLREVNNALSRVTGMRSPVPEEVEALSDKQVRIVRKFWLRHAHTSEGSDLLVEAFHPEKKFSIRKLVKMSQKVSDKALKPRPLTDHLIALVYDGDLPFPAWKATFRYLTDYIARPFRPVERRDKEVVPEERKGVVTAVRKFFEPEPEKSGGGGKTTGSPDKATAGSR